MKKRYLVLIVMAITVPTFATASQTLSPPVTVTGSLSGPMVRVVNDGSGFGIETQSNAAGVHSTSRAANGLYGGTENPSQFAKQAAGVRGDDLCSRANGCYSSNVGVLGYSPNRLGVLGKSDFGSGVMGVTNAQPANFEEFGIGVFGLDSNFGPAILANVGVQGVSNSVGYGVLAFSDSGIGLQASTGSGTALQVLTVEGKGIGPAIRVSAEKTHSSYYQDIMTVDNQGDMAIAGRMAAESYVTNAAPQTVHRTAAGTNLITYAGQQTVATVEDMGAANLISGQAFVQLEPKFASMIDPRVAYLVFITPRGDSRGVYIAQQGPTGFSVRENQGGRSSLIFDYRIVGKPLGSSETRLPAAAGTSGLKTRTLPWLKPPFPTGWDGKRP